MKLTITNDKGTWDVTGLVPMVRWSGDYQQAARRLDFSLVSTPSDASIPVVDCPLGAAVQLTEGSRVLFDGFIISRTGSTEGGTLDLFCFDRGFYLKRNQANYKFVSQTPEAITAQIAADFGFSVGEAAATGVQITRRFLNASSLYDIISTAYTLAAGTTGKAYHIGFVGDKLNVTVKEPGERALVIRGGSNLIAAQTTESIENLISRVQIYGADDALLQTVEDAERLKLYGCLQEILRQADGEDKLTEAGKLLEDSGVSQKITVDCLGDVTSITGGAVLVEEPHTGLTGLFFIDSDIHEWKRGQYYNKLVLNFKAIMNEAQAGSEE